MAKKTLFILLISLLLISCISVKADSESPASQSDFVTATLAPRRLNGQQQDFGG